MSQENVFVKHVEAKVNSIVSNIDPKQVALNILERVKDGKKLQEFTAEDWADALGLNVDTLVWDDVKKGLEVVFARENDTEFVAESLATATMTVKEYFALFRAGEMSEADFLFESEWVCLDAVVEILASYLRERPIEIESLNIVITDEMLKMRYRAIVGEIQGEWIEMLERHAAQQQALDEALDEEYSRYIAWLEKDLDTYMELLPRAFSDDPAEALAGSAELATFMKLPQAEVLGTVDDVDDYFLG